MTRRRHIPSFDGLERRDQPSAVMSDPTVPRPPAEPTPAPDPPPEPTPGAVPRLEPADRVSAASVGRTCGAGVMTSTIFLASLFAWAIGSLTGYAAGVRKQSN